MSPLWEEDVRRFGDILLCAFLDNLERKKSKIV